MAREPLIWGVEDDTYTTMWTEYPSDQAMVKRTLRMWTEYPSDQAMVKRTLRIHHEVYDEYEGEPCDAFVGWHVELDDSGQSRP